MKKIITLFVGTLIYVGGNAQWDTLITNTTTNFNSISFTNENNGVAVGKDVTLANGKAYQTTDGGLTWVMVNSGTSSYNDVFFQNANRGWIAADSGYILETINSGQTWGNLTHIGTQNFNCIHFPTDTVGFVAGDNGCIYKTSDLGLSWDTLDSGTLLSINDIFFTDGLNGWIVGDGGYIAATLNGGNTWTQVSQPFFGFMNIHGFAYNASYANAIAVGNLGDALFSSNSGMNWSIFSSGVTSTLNKVAFTNNLAGVIVGENGVILRTEDGGTTWMRDSVWGVTENLKGICWASDTLAYVCGVNGIILKSQSDISSVRPIIKNNMDISAFPNPFIDVLAIRIELGKSSVVQINVLDVTGRILLTENKGICDEGKQIFHLNGIFSLSGGMYFVTVKTENEEVTIPVVKN